jgi:anti-sigma factor RsiW
MNNSEPSLSSFEEKLMAYVDGRLPAEEASAFEREHPEAVVERDSANLLNKALKRGSIAPSLRNPDFLNRQILREIASTLPKEARVAEVAPERQPSFFNLWRLVLAGAFCLLLALGVYQGFVRPGSPGPSTIAKTSVNPAAGFPPYLAQVLSMKTGDEKLTSRVVTEEGLTVVMIDGLDPMSEEFIF